MASSPGEGGEYFGAGIGRFAERIFTDAAILYMGLIATLIDREDNLK